jgi:hypothetical protein
VRVNNARICGFVECGWPGEKLLRYINGQETWRGPYKTVCYTMFDTGFVFSVMIYMGYRAIVWYYRCLCVSEVGSYETR